MKQSVWRHVPAVLVSIGFAFAGARAAWAEATTTSTTGNWNDAIWTMGVPESGDTVTLAHNVTLTNTTPVCGSITLNAGKTLTFNGTNTALQATNIVLYGTVTHDVNTDTNGTPGVYGDWVADSGIWIACTNLTVATGSVINANWKGYAGGGTYGRGNGPGGGAQISIVGGGGGYGGQGGTYQVGAEGGPVYGSVSAPADPGSGGGGSDQGSGAAGGGYVRLDVAGHLLINGIVSANGRDSTTWRASGGSGGGIYATCHTLGATNGTVSVDGGNGNGSKTACAGGGGGRIALIYDTTAQSNLNVTAKPLLQISANDGCGEIWGRAGTIYLPDASVYPGPTIQGGQLVIPGFSSWSPSSLFITNGLAVFPAGFTLQVTNDLLIAGLGGIEVSNGTVSVGGDLTIDNMSLYWAPAYYFRARSFFYAGTGSQLTVNGNMSVDEGSLYVWSQDTNAVLFTVGGNLQVTNNARLYIYSAATNDGGNNYGALVDVKKTLLIGTQSWVYALSDWTNGGSPLFKVKNLTVSATNAGLSANSGGFRGGHTGHYAGYGPGFGSSLGSGSGGGGGYGGSGGTYGGGVGGVTYGSSNMPMDPGSGGGALANGGRGGGLVRVEAANTVNLNGTLSANGGSEGGWHEGAGSGGGIYLRCRVLSGTTGTLSARGGDGETGSSGGGGGGGRIAVWTTFTTTGGVWQVSTTNGSGGTGAGIGTVTWGWLPAGPLVDNAGGATGITVTTAWLNGMVTSTGTAETAVSVFWGTSDGSTNCAAWSHTNDFPGFQAEGALSANVLGLIPGTNYYYRFYGTNSAGEFWAETAASFVTPPGIPVVTNAPAGATNITLSSAFLNGELLSTGTAQTAVSVCWGTSDGGTNVGVWANTNAFGYVDPGSLSTNVGLSSSNTIYFYTFYASNSEGEVWAQPSSRFLCGDLSVDATDNTAQEKGAGKTGTFTIYRPSDAAVTNSSLTVFYQATGTATAGLDYDALPGTVVIPQGAVSATVTVNPLMDSELDNGETVILNLLPGSYVVGSPSNATVTIADMPPDITNTWTGVGNWTSRTNWSDEMAPVVGQHVVISGTVTAAAPAALASLTVQAACTLVLDGWAAMTVDQVRVSGTISHTPNTDTVEGDGWTPDQRVFIVCTNLAVKNGGKIDVSGKGYSGGLWFGSGSGPGGGTYLPQCGSGGGYGGNGGNASTPGGPTYGEAQTPSDPGSGGGGCDTDAISGKGGRGGGVVRIIAADNVAVDGAIRADGYQGAGWRAGQGAGGSVYITCRTFSSTSGVITADGADGPGNGSDGGGGGGGGRIALVYDPAAQSSVNATGRPVVKLSTKSGKAQGPGWPGTLYLPDAGFYPAAQIYGGQIVIPAFTNWTIPSLSISEGLACFTNGFRLTVSNNLVVNGLGGLALTNGNLLVGGDLQIQNTIETWGPSTLLNARTFLVAGPAANYSVAGNFGLTGGNLYLYSAGSNVLVVNVSGNLTLTNYARVYVQSGLTNSGGPGYGALLNVAKTMLIGDQSWVYPLSDNTNGGSPLFRMGNLTVSTTNSGFNADSGGFRGGHAGHYLGYGPGYGTSYGSGSGGGGGYGGPGGTYGGGAGGVTYGSSNAPVDPGSGGGALTTGGRGGGLVRIEAANAVSLDGTLSANGGSEGGWNEGAGSGGGIYVRAKAFSGNAGTLSACGGSGEAGSSGGGGGGGRIAICSSYVSTSGVWQVSATQGAGGAGAGDGTIVWRPLALPGTLFVVH